MILLRNVGAIILFDPLDVEKKEIHLNEDEYICHDNYFYVKTEFSNCMLTLIKNESNQLIDLYTKEVVGRFVCDTPTVFNRPL